MYCDVVIIKVIYVVVNVNFTDAIVSVSASVVKCYKSCCIVVVVVVGVSVIIIGIDRCG